jgi:hypothetical protein
MDAMTVVYVWAQAHSAVILVGFFLTLLGVFGAKGKTNHNQNNIRNWG